ncbi:LAETG motif-containing sortase-dependent surface protein [Streptomyces sp. NPDC003719]
MAAAAATAVIAPLALLAAPAAYATDESPAPSASSSTPAGEETESPAPTTTESESPAPGTTESETATPPAPSDPVTTQPTTTAPGESETTSPAPSTSAPTEEPTQQPDVPYCDEIDADYANAKVSATVKGLPGKIVAGDGYHPFELVVTNDSKTDVEELAFFAVVENYEFDEAKYLSPYVDLEFKNPQTGKWKRIGNDEWSGDYFYFVDKLKAKASASVKLRVSIDAQAPAGDAYSVGAGAYLDKVDGQECIAEGWGEYDFQVLKPGSENPAPGTATPSDKGDKPSVKQPQGNVSALPTGSLAETGSSSAMPMIGLAGGLAVLVGGGAVFVVRRRKTGAEA